MLGKVLIPSSEVLKSWGSSPPSFSFGNTAVLTLQCPPSTKRDKPSLREQVDFGAERKVRIFQPLNIQNGLMEEGCLVSLTIT